MLQKVLRDMKFKNKPAEAGPVVYCPSCQVAEEGLEVDFPSCQVAEVPL